MIDFMSSRVEIDLVKLGNNVEVLLNLYGSKNIGIMGVTKVVCGIPEIAQVLVNKGIRILADSKIGNLRNMRNAKIKAEFILLKTPSLSEVDQVIKYADISINTEISVIKSLSAAAVKNGFPHKIILMVDLGDLREGILPADIDGFIEEVLQLPGIAIVGIGANFACLGGVKPTEDKMSTLSLLADHIEEEFNFPLAYISGGNSANYNWFMASEDIGTINNIRIGESIFLGCETLGRTRIPNLFTNVFTFVAEVIESKIKGSLPDGDRGQNAFGISPEFHDRGQIRRVILGVGCQDVLVSGLTPRLDIDILGSSSDHIIIDAKRMELKVGDEVEFDLNYGALLSVMTSPNVDKKYIRSSKLDNQTEQDVFKKL
ncbi:alanine/ornithine racemase family PLP-dependent enzyme [Neobacillus drentensis]|uniref:alanine/ornithine racemase family PLP-dependent enzyme n=1 Tax=Neobacillus drentensis TaxID=220684 RepID=UPI000AAE0E11|nr:alanine/ornithine racemase family PLP-dependent enzyme [Neobacillus drentensis]